MQAPQPPAESVVAAPAAHHLGGNEQLVLDVKHGFERAGISPKLKTLLAIAGKVQQAHQAGRGFYDFYVGERITGFTSHWNTYSAEEMFALIMLGAFLFFAGPRKRSWVWLMCAGLIAMAVLLGETRAIWIGTAVAGLYLVWFWRRWMTLLVPAAILVAFVVSPAAIRERFTSIFRPQQVDSNQFRMITWRTGIRMIEAHPWLGLGPEGVKYHFQEWVPPDVPRPLPVGWYGHLHNIYLQYAAERGIPTMLIMMWMLFQILFDFWKGLRALPPGRGDRRFLLHGGIAVVLATMAEGFFEYNLGDSEVLTMSPTSHQEEPATLRGSMAAGQSPHSGPNLSRTWQSVFRMPFRSAQWLRGKGLRSVSQYYQLVGYLQRTGACD